MPSKNLTIVQMNDSHAYLDLHPELFWENGKAVYRMAGGYARIATILNQIRAENPGQVLFLDGGDTFHGTYSAVQTNGDALVPILNALRPAAMTAHWEFAYTPKGFKKLTANLEYPMLAINVHTKESGENYFKPYQVVEIGGLRVGIAGNASNIVDKTMPPQFSEGVYFTNGVYELPGVVKTLRQQENADLVVLLSHLGFPQDMQLLQLVHGVDVALSAHTHHRLDKAHKQGDALVIQSGSQGAFLTRLDLTIEDGKICDYRHQLLEVSEKVVPDPEIEEAVTKALSPYTEYLNEEVGHTVNPMNRAWNLESSMDNFLLEVIMEHTGAEITFSNGWRFGAPVVPGPIRRNDLYNMVPMDPVISTVELSGAELKLMLENNLEHTFSRDPLNQMGGYVKRALGITVLLKVENPPGTRIHKIFLGKNEIKDDVLYYAAYITEQGVPPNLGQNHRHSDLHIVAAMEYYLARKGTIEIGMQNTFQLI